MVELWLYTFLEVSWYSVNQTASTLISQAHGAESTSAKHGWFAISLVAAAIGSTFVAISGLSTELVLSQITPDKELVRLGAKFTEAVVPAIYFSGFHGVISTYFTASGYAEYSTICSFFYCFLDIFLTYIFLFGGLGIQPFDNPLLAIAQSWNVSSFFGLVLNAVLFARVMRAETAEADEAKEKPMAVASTSSSPQQEHRDRPPTQRRYSDLDEYLDVVKDAELMTEEKTVVQWLGSQLAWRRFFSQWIPTCITSATENMIFFVLGLFVAHLSRSQIAAHNTCSAIIEYAFSLSYGMFEATSVRIGYYVGKGDYTGSMTVLWMSVVNSFVIGILLAILCAHYSLEIAQLFTQDQEIIAYILQVSPLLYASIAIFSSGDQMLAILQGQGRTKIEMFSSLFALWGITLPLAAYFFFLRDGALVEIWWALLVGYIVMEVIAGYCVYLSDWESLFLRAKEYAELD
jgi:Na+-driven multidrug efflux pump